jgi:hypothetical protein
MATQVMAIAKEGALPNAAAEPELTEEAKLALADADGKPRLLRDGGPRAQT